MKVYAVVTVANEIDGRFTAVRFEKAYLQQQKAQEYVTQLTKNWRETIQVQGGSIDCMCERGIHELDVEE